MMELINAAKSGNRKALDQLLTAIYEFVKLKAAKHSRAQDTDDLCHETLLRIYRTIERFAGDSVESFLSWVYWKVRSVATRYYTKRRPGLAHDSELSSLSYTSSEPAIDIHDEIEHAEHLAPMAVSMLRLHVEGESMNDIGRRFGVTSQKRRMIFYRLRKAVAA